ncbi:MAG: phosphoribosylaminoimidazolesuccinocarboxamide synthase, partial [Phycisphaerales bacterium]
MNSTEQSVYETHLPFEGRKQGKVRDIYQIPASGDEPGMVLIIASDRISAFDVVMPTPVTGKGRELTRISCK